MAIMPSTKYIFTAPTLTVEQEAERDERVKKQAVKTAEHRRILALSPEQVAEETKILQAQVAKLTAAATKAALVAPTTLVADKPDKACLVPAPKPATAPAAIEPTISIEMQLILAAKKKENK